MGRDIATAGRTNFERIALRKKPKFDVFKGGVIFHERFTR